MMDPIVVRVYCGGMDGYQVPFCRKALADFASEFEDIHGRKILREYKYVQDMRKDKWDPQHLVDWLLESDFHVIATHVHQGNKRWSSGDVYLQLHRLRDHPGFPNGEQLSCPVFLQHKFQYLMALPEFVNPTLAVKLPRAERIVGEDAVEFNSSIHSTRFDVESINNFLDANNEGCGWVVKYSFTTMRDGLKFCKTKHDVYHSLAIASFEYSWRVSYAMIQPCLKNRKEYKVVVLNGKASHVLPQKANGVVVKGGKGFSDAPHADLFRFAETGVERLSQICAGTISDFIIRVDVMQRANGNMIINEFESFEAVYTSGKVNEMHVAQRFFHEYWGNVFFIQIGELN